MLPKYRKYLIVNMKIFQANIRSSKNYSKPIWTKLKINPGGNELKMEWFEMRYG